MREAERMAKSTLPNIRSRRTPTWECPVVAYPSTYFEGVFLYAGRSQKKKLLPGGKLLMRLLAKREKNGLQRVSLPGTENR